MGSKIQTGPDFEWSKRGWVANPEAQPFEIRTNGHHFCKKNLDKKSKFQIVQCSNGWDYSYSHSLSPTFWKLNHLKSTFKKSGLQMVGFQIPTVLIYGSKFSTNAVQNCIQNPKNRMMGLYFCFKFKVEQRYTLDPCSRRRYLKNIFIHPN